MPYEELGLIPIGRRGGIWDRLILREPSSFCEIAKFNGSHMPVMWCIMQSESLFAERRQTDHWTTRD